MAQTTAAFAGANFSIDISLDGTTWVNIGGTSTSVEVSGGTQFTGQVNTADGFPPIVVNSNKTEAVNITVNILYTEAPNPDAFAVVWAQFIGTNKVIYFRYAPRGTTAANKRYVASNALNAPFPCPIISCLPPATDASSGDPAMSSFEIICPKLFQEAIP